VGLEPLTLPGQRLARSENAPVALEHERPHALHDVAVDLDELRGGVARAKIVALAAEDRVRVGDHPAMSSRVRLRPVLALTLTRARFIARCEGQRCMS
jgi:hypothetical protein